MAHYLACACWIYSRPGYGKSEILDAVSLHEVNVIKVLVIEIICDGSSAAICNLSWGMGEGVPDCWSTAICINSPLEL